ncbi:MAG: hypothetical protein HUK22_07605 [Thermoguttaceae bacterium]|nr:hypothetical protein [Thermoguttaceae bacterium]
MANMMKTLIITLAGCLAVWNSCVIADAATLEGDEMPEPTRILFIGNSYTYVNSLDQMLGDMLNVSGYPTETRRNAPGGWRLRQHFLGEVPENMTPTPEVIKSARWDFVVLQEQSAGSVNERDEFLEYGAKLAALIRETSSNSTVLLYQTWARCDGMLKGFDGSNDARKAEIVAAWEKRYGKKADEKILAALKDGIRGGYAALAEKSGATVVPTGECFAEIDANFGGKIDLYAPEGKQRPHHPSQAGTFLAACAFFKTITGQSPVGVYAKMQAAGRKFDFGPDVAEKLEKTADATVKTGVKR